MDSPTSSVADTASNVTENSSLKTVCRIVTVIPAYNEERFVGSVILQALKCSDAVVVVDDGSTDATAEIAEAAGVIVIRHAQNSGKGVALNTGFSRARELGAAAVVVLDGDGQHRADEIMAVVQPVLDNMADLVVGSRYLQHTSVVPVHRIWGHRVFNLITKEASGVSVTNSQSGFRAFSREALEAICFSSRGFSVESEMQFLAKRHNLRVAEIPITIHYEDKPKRSVVSQGIMVASGIIRLFGQYRPLFFFGTIGFTVLLAGLAWELDVVQIFLSSHQVALGSAVLGALLILIGNQAIFSGVLLHSIRGLLQADIQDKCHWRLGMGQEEKWAPPRASVVIVNYNGIDQLRRCLASLSKQDYPNCDTWVVDNASADGSADCVAQEFPWVHLIRNAANLGYADANNIGFEHSAGEYIAVLNPDTVVEPEWLRELVRALEADPRAGLATSRILLMDHPGRINACGNEITFTGLTFCRGLEQPADRYLNLEPVSAVSGAAFAIKCSVLNDAGNFDGDFFMYYEDTDLSLRAMLAGYTCLYVPTSVVYHQYTFRFSPHKCYFQERNRYVALLKTLRWRTLLILLPSLLISEMIAWGYAFLRGPRHLVSKARSHVWLVRSFPQILGREREVQALRRVDDRWIIARFGYRCTFNQTVNPWVAAGLECLVNPLLLLLAVIARNIVAW